MASSIATKGQDGVEGGALIRSRAAILVGPGPRHQAAASGGENRARPGPAPPGGSRTTCERALAGSQILMWRVSGMMNRQMMKHTAGTTMG